MCQSTECRARNVFVCNACGYEHEIAPSGKGRGRTKCRNCRSPIQGYLEWMQKVTGAYCECGRKKSRRSKRCSVCACPARVQRPCKRCGKTTANDRYCSKECSQAACRGSKIGFRVTQSRINAWKESRKPKTLRLDNALWIRIVDRISESVCSDLEVAMDLKAKTNDVAKVRRRAYSVCLCCGCKSLGGNCQVCASHLAYYKRKAIRPRVIICKECCEFFVRAKNPSQFCSKGCLNRHQKRNRKHRQRSNGLRYELISVLNVIRPNCEICGVDLNMPTQTWNPDAATLDHIVPLSKGGSHSLDNVRCVCHLCNSLRGNRDISDQEVRFKRVAYRISKLSKKA